MKEFNCIPEVNRTDMNNALSDVRGLDPPHLDEMFACIRDFGKAREVGFVYRFTPFSL